MFPSSGWLVIQTSGGCEPNYLGRYHTVGSAPSAARPRCDRL